MSLRERLASATSEEDVKDAYVEALQLTDYSKGLVDIKTDTVWFEAKSVTTPSMVMLAQLLVYIKGARERGERIPGHLAGVDRTKAALVETGAVLAVFDDHNIDWPDKGSDADKVLAGKIAPYVEPHVTSYDVVGNEAEFIHAIRSVIEEGSVIRIPITPANVRQVFDRWVEMIGSELDVVHEANYAALFFADIMLEGDDPVVPNQPVRVLWDRGTGRPVFHLQSGHQIRTYDLANERGYRNFWSIYHRPPAEQHRHYLLERRDILLPIDEQRFKGAYYTPLHIVDKAYDQLAATLGEDWQERYIVWDMCCGVGNLEVKHGNYRNIYMSTLDQVDIDLMQARGICPGAEMFQYDYLNDDIDDFGNIDYSITNKVPLSLRQAIADANTGQEGSKPILILVNPPYAEATSGGLAVPVAGGENKRGVARTRFATTGMEEYGKARNELFMQFIARNYQEIPSAILAIFSKVKYISTPTLRDFREVWKAKFLGGFAVHSRAFEALKGNFPIGFFIWDTGASETVSSVHTRALDSIGESVGAKTFMNFDDFLLLTDWVKRPLSNATHVVPLKNAVVPATATKDLRGDRWADDAVAWLNCAGNDPQNANSKTMLFSSGYGSARGFFVTKGNLWQAAIVFAVRRLIIPTWLNDRDQFLQPSEPLSDTFKSDCLVWMLFNGSNLTAGADGLEWDGREWSLVNHFIPFTEKQTGARGRFESDFMVQHMAKIEFSPEAQVVLNEGLVLWRQFHATSFPHTIRDDLKLGRPDTGWYQIRKALEAYGKSELVDFDPFKAAYIALGDKLRPQVYELGFLPE